VSEPQIKRIAFVTSADWRELWIDDHAAVQELNRRGHIVDAVVWDDPAIEWEHYDAVVLRSTWDYYLKADAFGAWIDAQQRNDVNLWNPAPTLKWNLDKIYLRELRERGVPVTPTVFVDEQTDLKKTADEQGWTDLVIKPRISAAGHRTIRCSMSDPDGIDAHQAELDDLIRHGGALIQPFLPEIQADGEWSFIFLDGRFSHAARKRPAQGEFRVQVQFGGTTDPAEPDESLVKQAQAVVNAVPHEWMYARVDGCVVDGQLLLMELEMLEPSLFLLQDPASPGRLADAIERRLP
jgi:glutathione synthase/RimK-type ligase-like ATP-grasp enzyme